eukprot:5750513-Lingulodinium_polyedra.AAC.1
MGMAAAGGAIITHAIWADNFVTFAPSMEAFRTQAEELACMIHKMRMRWKDSSLQYLVAKGTAAQQEMKVKVDGREY